MPTRGLKRLREVRLLQVPAALRLESLENIVGQKMRRHYRSAVGIGGPELLLMQLLLLLLLLLTGAGQTRRTRRML